MNQDEAVLVLQDLGIDRYLDDPVPALVDAPTTKQCREPA